MSREEATDELYRLLSDCVNNAYPIRNNTQKGRYREAVKMAVEALEQEPCGDCISRQAVIDKMKERDNNELSCLTVKNVRELPSVSPMPRWIPVSERLPDKLKNVLIVIEEEKVCEVAYMRNSYNATYRANGAKDEFILSTGVTYACYKVDAWMPIPTYNGGDADADSD